MSCPTPRMHWKSWLRIAGQVAVGTLVLNVIFGLLENYANIGTPRLFLNDPIGTLRRLAG